MVQVAVSELPAVTPVTPEPFEEGVVTEPVPDHVHAPVPTVGTLPPKVKVVVLHLFWSVPALATVAVA